MKAIKTAAATAAIALIVPVQAFAQAFTAPAALGPDTLLGAATAGSETGIYEYPILIAAAALVLVGLVLAMKGIQWVRKIVRSA